MKIKNKYTYLGFLLIAVFFLFSPEVKAQKVFKSGDYYYTVTDPIKKTVMLVPENWKGNSNNEELNLTLEIKISESLSFSNLEDVTIEIYKSLNDLEIGDRILLKGKTDATGTLRFTANGFALAHERWGLDELNGVYYINAYKGEFRSKSTTAYLNFSEDRTHTHSLEMNAAFAEPITVKVALVYENFTLPQTEISIHKSFGWMAPDRLCESYKRAMEEAARGVVQYEIVQIIEADTTFTYYTANNPDRIPISKFEVGRRLLDREGWRDFEASTRYNYNRMISYYGFDQMRDNDEVHEVWVATQPFSGMWESHMMGKDAFWCNSPPAENPTCDKLLTVMFFNYERSTAEAVHSFGHRFESIMMQVYGWENYKNKHHLSQLTNYELFATHQMQYQKYDENCSGDENCFAHVGICHFPPNAQFDYDYANSRYVNSYAEAWYNYPYVREDMDLVRNINCETWGCDQLKYLKWWYSHIPAYEGLNQKDLKLNNWWYYLMNYNEAKEKELELINQMQLAPANQ